MKKINTQAIITGLRSKVDGSLGLTVSTPELTSEEKTEFFNLQNKNLMITIVPEDEKPDDMISVKADMEGKSPSQRQRAIIFVLFKQQNNIKTFNEFYERTMEAIIDKLKAKAD